MKKQTFILTAIVCLALSFVAFFGIRYIYTYQTDREVLENNFITGKVKIDLTEPEYPGNDADEVKDQLGNQETLKNPKVTNVDVNDVVIFIKMTVPVENVIQVHEDGTKDVQAKQEIYYFKLATDAASAHTNNFRSSWIELPERETGTDLAGNTRTYIFGYSLKVAPNATTDALFDKIQFKNLLEENLATTAQENIKIEAFAIQADNIINNGAIIPTNSTISKTNLLKIYDIYMNQNS